MRVSRITSEALEVSLGTYERSQDAARHQWQKNITETSEILH